MTDITNHTFGPIAALSVGALALRELPDVQPFTIRSGYSFEGILSDIRTWIRDVLVPYLDDNSAQVVFQQNVDQVVDKVNAALTGQAQLVANALNAAVQEIVNEQATVSDALVVTVLQNALSQTRAWLDQHYAAASDVAVIRKFYAPPPRTDGGDDTAALLAAASLAVTTRGTLILDGQYNANLDLPSSFRQAWIEGRGRKYTKITAFDPSKPTVKFNGGSGSLAGGGMRSLSINGKDHNVGGGVGIAFSGCGGVTVEDVDISEVNVGVLWWNERQNDFTEFCTFSGSMDNTFQPFVYRKDNNRESFHGSGPKDALVQMRSDNGGPVVATVGDALPYNAPMGLKVFFGNQSQFLMNYANSVSGRHASYYGSVTIEGSIGPNELVRGGNKVLFQGAFEYFGSGAATLGKLFLCSKISYEGGNVIGEFLPVTERYSLSNAPTSRFTGVLRNGEAGMVAVHITAGNYDLFQILFVYQSPYDAGGPTPIVMATMSNIDNRSAGLPTYSWNNGLFIANPNFTNEFTANAKMTVLGGALGNSDLAQVA